MRLLVKQNLSYAEIFRLGFYKSQHKNVIGEYILFDLLEKMIPNGSGFHSHFIYVETGDYHFSIKYYDEMEKTYVDRKTYYNHIATRKGDSPNFGKNTPVERRDKNMNDPLDSFMMGERLKPWRERPLGHHFGTVAVNLDANGEKKLNWDNTIIPGKDDLVIDLFDVKGKIINFGAGLFSKDNPSFIFENVPENTIMFEKSLTQEELVLRLNVIVAH